MSYILSCQNCGDEFEASYKKAKYCLRCRNKMRMQHTSESIQKKYGMPWYYMTKEARDKAGSRVSSVNKKFEKLLTDRGYTVIEEYSIGSKQYDLYVTQLDLLIELDPTYTHNFLGNHWEKHGFPYDYQLEKSRVAWEHNHACIHVFDWDDWNSVIEMICRGKQELVSGTDMSKYTGLPSPDDIENIGTPNMTWSKENKYRVCYDTKEFENLINDGWLPIFDCGYYDDDVIVDLDEIQEYFKDKFYKNQNRKQEVTKICAYCGEPFVQTNGKQIYCKRPHYMTCPVCGKEYLVTNNEKLKRPPTACSYPCRVALTQKHSMEKYGVKTPGNNPEARKKASETMMKNLGVPYAMMSKDVYKKSVDTLVERYGVTNIKKLNGQKHRLEFKFESYPWEDQDIARKMQEPRVKLDSKEFTIYRLTDEIADRFYNSNCTQGSPRGQLLHLGLVKDDEVYQMMSFGRPSSSRKHHVQLHRMCTRLGFEFEDGYQKLFEYATSENGYDLSNIVAYCDFSKSDGSEYEQLGMRYVKKNQAKIVWVKGNQVVQDATRMSRNISRQTMIDSGFEPIYDKGQLVFEY